MAGKAKAGKTLWEMLGRIPDDRSRLGRRFELRAVLGLAIAAILAGRTSMAAVARWGRSLLRRSSFGCEGRRLGEETLKEFGIYRKKSPCQSTFHYVFLGLEVSALEKALAK